MKNITKQIIEDEDNIFFINVPLTTRFDVGMNASIEDAIEAYEHIVKNLKQTKQQILEEFKDVTEINVEQSCDNEMLVYFTRYETDDEYNERIEEELEVEKFQKDERHKAYLKLKREFEK